MTASHARVPLVLLHHSGGSAASFRPLLRMLPEWMDARPLELPGRGRKWREDLLTSASAAVSALGDEARAAGLGRAAILGESLGAYLAIGLAAIAEYCPLVIAVSNSALATRRSFLPFSVAGCSDEEILNAARRFSDLPESVVDDPELAERAIQTLRADFQLSESAIEDFRPLVVDAPLHIVVGRSDKNLDGELSDWQLSTRSALSIEKLDSGHLLSAETPAELARVITVAMSPLRYEKMTWSGKTPGQDRCAVRDLNPEPAD